MLKNEKARRSAARKAGWYHGRHDLRSPMPTKFRTAIEREEFAAGIEEGKADAVKAAEDADRELEALHNAPVPEPDLPDNSKIVTCQILDRSVSHVVARAIADLISEFTGLPLQTIPMGSFSTHGQDGGFSAQLGQIDCQAVRKLCNAIEEERKREFQRGRDDGNNLLLRLANGETTPDAYEETRARQRRELKTKEGT